jgi:chitin disaccharide deacetylase
VTERFTTNVSRRFLIVNADDFGLSSGTNAGIIEAHDHGIVTSASLMVRARASVEAAALAAERPNLSVGLHIDLGEWMYRDSGWHLIDFVVDIEDRGAVQLEVSRQLDRFAMLIGRRPSHLDSHQHAHRQEPACSVIRDEAERLGVPLRHYDARIAYRGDFYGQTGNGHPLAEAITPQGLIRILEDLPAGVTELSCHPGKDQNLNTMYRREREREVEALCAPQVRAAVEKLGIELIAFDDIRANRPVVSVSCGER